MNLSSYGTWITSNFKDKSRLSLLLETPNVKYPYIGYLPVQPCRPLTALSLEAISLRLQGLVQRGRGEAANISQLVPGSRQTREHSCNGKVNYKFLSILKILKHTQESFKHLCSFSSLTDNILFRPKMREIVHLQAGQCGNQIGSKVTTKMHSTPHSQK